MFSLIRYNQHKMKISLNNILQLQRPNLERKIALQKKSERSEENSHRRQKCFWVL